MPKKIKPIKAEKYKEPEEYKDDYFEDDTIENETVEEHSYQTFKVSEDRDEEYYEDANKTFRRMNFSKMFNIVFTILILAILIIGIDVINITKFNNTPIFAIKTKTYNDGGTAEYYGLGYKVIKYNEDNGRKDIQIGYWNLKYSTEPIVIQDVELAIEFQNNPEQTAKKYYKQYVMISSTIKEIDLDHNKILLEYKDPDGKYTLEINSSVESPKDLYSKYQVNDKITIKGTIYNFSIQEDNKPNSVVLLDCFIN